MLARLIRPSGDRTARRRATLTALVIALLAGTTTAFALTEALKLDRAPLTVRRFDDVVSPSCRCPSRTAWLAIRLGAADTIDAWIIDGDGQEVRVLANGVRRPAGIVRFKWRGRDDAGRLVPEGSYRLRIRLREAGRTVVIPRTIRAIATPA